MNGGHHVTCTHCRQSFEVEREQWPHGINYCPYCGRPPI